MPQLNFEAYHYPTKKGIYTLRKKNLNIFIYLLEKKFSHFNFEAPSPTPPPQKNKKKGTWASFSHFNFEAYDYPTEKGYQHIIFCKNK